jgi:hypothetical protein
VEIETSLPEGAEVVVFTVNGDEKFDLDDSHVAELEARIANADRGDIEPAAAVLARLQRR